MNVIRILGALIIVFSGFAAAYMLNGAAKLGLAQAEAFIALIRFIRSEIECYSTPVPRVLERCSRSILSACGYTDEQAPASFDELVKKCRIYDSVIQKTANSFAEGIGRGYRDEQLSLCDYYIARLEERRRVLAAELPVRKKMNSALCISGALAIVILLA